VCFWNVVPRLASTRPGADSFPMSTIDVAVAVRWTDDLPVSLSVISFQSDPPHHAPGAVSTRAPAGTADAARIAAAAAAAVTTSRILGTSESIQGQPQQPQV